MNQEVYDIKKIGEGATSQVFEMSSQGHAIKVFHSRQCNNVLTDLFKNEEKIHK